MGGSEVTNQSGVYGSLGQPAAGNAPGARSGGVSWVDGSGNLWMFGGSGYDSSGTEGELSDLWEYKPQTNQWTWIGGSNAANKTGVYGTLGTAASGNIPGGRDSAVGWTDKKGNFWLFGGTGQGAAGPTGLLNDMWVYAPSTNQWTWIGGSQAAGQIGTIGAFGKFAPSNMPGSRGEAVSWTDGNGNFWLFGGYGPLATNGSPYGSFLNDLWEFNPSTGQWAWISGTSATSTLITGEPGVYGAFQVPDPANVPGSRTGAVSWIDGKGNLYLFGGEGFDSAGNESVLNDLWEFNPATNEWSWMAGNSTVAQNCASIDQYCGPFGVYGELGLPALPNSPGGRYSASGWKDTNGYFWLFGGDGFDSQYNFGYLSDVWEFQPNTGSSLITATPTITPGSGTYSSWQSVTISDSTPSAIVYYSVNGQAPVLKYTSPITVSSSETIEAIAVSSGNANSAIATANYAANFSQAAAPTFSVASGNYSSSQTVAISDSTPGATVFYAIGDSPTVPTTPYNGPIVVSSSETVQAIAVAENYLNSTVTSAAYNIGPSPSSEWTWMGGNNDFVNDIRSGWYGTLRTAAAANVPGGRKQTVSWTDNQGNLWLFGGLGYDGAQNTASLNDLWKYNPSTALWTWMSGSSVATNCQNGGCGMPGIYGTQGTPSPSNTPGGRYGAVGWTDATGNLWLFGGIGYDANGTTGFLNDLWKFDPTTLQWTWMAGAQAIPNLYTGVGGVYGTLGVPASGNTPGGRAFSATWTDLKGNFWIYGGNGEDVRDLPCFLDDLWELNPSTVQWSWQGGFTSCPVQQGGIPAVYGVLGLPQVGTIPWSIQSPTSWADTNGNFWLFGGIGYDTTSTGYRLNDTWEFNPPLGEWAWRSPNSSGAPGGSASGIYGTQGQFSPANIPGQRAFASSWTDLDGNFWLFGGSGIASGTVLDAGSLNDLWEFKPSINQWAWVSGSNAVPLQLGGQAGQYGTLGMPAPANVPGARSYAASWTDRAGNLWLFGGLAMDKNDQEGMMNDLWQFGLTNSPTAHPPIPTATPTFSLASGTYSSPQTLTISDQTSGATIYYTTDGSTPFSNSPVYAGPITVASGTEFVSAIAVANGDTVSSVAGASYTITSPATATPTFSVPAGSYSSAQSVTISDGTPNATIYYTTNGTTPTTSSTVYSGPITVSSSETIEAIATATGYTSSSVASATYTINLPPSFSLAESAGTLTIASGGQGSVTLTVTPQNGFNSAVSFACSGLPSGASCVFSPATVTPTSGAATTTLTISAAQSAAIQRKSLIFPSEFAVLFALGICGFRRRRSLRTLFLLVVAMGGLSLLSACGGGGGGTGSGGGSSPTVSTVTVTATSGTLQQTVKLTLTVN